MRIVCFPSSGFPSLACPRIRRVKRRPRVVIGGLLLLLATAPLTLSLQAAQPVQARTTPPSVVAPGKSATPSVEEIQYIKSVFEATGEGIKDPFYPNTDRLAKNRGPGPVTADLPDLVLKGITVAPDKRLAMINNKILELGEEAEIKAGGKLYKIKCMEIRQGSVLIKYRGVTKELALPKGY